MHETILKIGGMVAKDFEQGINSKESCLDATQKEKIEFLKNNYKNCINTGGKNETRTITKNI